MITQPVLVEHNPLLADWLGVDQVKLAREDLLPDGGGKKRRALARFVGDLEQIRHLHLLSYAGSHTAYTLSQLLPEVVIHLYGTHYGGGAYEEAMVRRLHQQQNVDQQIGSTLAMSHKFMSQKRKSESQHHFMKIGGSLGMDLETEQAVAGVVAEIGSDFHHYTAVASGDLLNSIASQTKQVTGVLTQPLAIRLLKSIELANTSGLYKPSLKKRIGMMHELQEFTGNLWDPIFVGVVFSYLKRQRKLPAKVCIWITCPSDIDWVG